MKELVAMDELLALDRIRQLGVGAVRLQKLDNAHCTASVCPPVVPSGAGGSGGSGSGGSSGGGSVALPCILALACCLLLCCRLVRLAAVSPLPLRFVHPRSYIHPIEAAPLLRAEMLSALCLPQAHVFHPSCRIALAAWASTCLGRWSADYCEQRPWHPDRVLPLVRHTLRIVSLHSVIAMRTLQRDPAPYAPFTPWPHQADALPALR